MSTNTIDKPRKVTTATLRKMKAAGEKIAMLTAYDYSMARLVDGSGMDVILVGDSATNVMAGNMTTLPMTLDEMIYHARCVVRGTELPSSSPTCPSAHTRATPMPPSTTPSA